MSQPAPEGSQPKTAKAAYERDQVVEIINSVISKVGESESFSREVVFAELKALKTVIDEARKELNQTGAGDIKDKHIPTATDELDAVIEATAEASGTIMDACDVIQEKAGAAGEAGDAITAEVMKIYEACSFQDITGQRITKVVTTLRTIEGKVNNLLEALGGAVAEGSGSSGDTEEDEGRGTGDEKGLLNGPQMPDKAITQDDIDKLLADFD